MAGRGLAGGDVVYLVPAKVDIRAQQSTRDSPAESLSNVSAVSRT